MTNKYTRHKDGFTIKIERFVVDTQGNTTPLNELEYKEQLEFRKHLTRRHIRDVYEVLRREKMKREKREAVNKKEVITVQG